MGSEILRINHTIEVTGELQTVQRAKRKMWNALKQFHMIVVTVSMF